MTFIFFPTFSMISLITYFTMQTQCNSSLTPDYPMLPHGGFLCAKSSTLLRINLLIKHLLNHSGKIYSVSQSPVKNPLKPAVQARSTVFYTRNTIILLTVSRIYVLWSTSTSRRKRKTYGKSNQELNALIKKIAKPITITQIFLLKLVYTTCLLHLVL